MPTSILSPALNIHPTPLTQSTFSPFGTVIESPLAASTSTFPSPVPKTPNVVPANQDTALKYLDVTHMRDLYTSAPSKIPSKAVMNMFSCFPRAVSLSTVNQTRRLLFDVKILERHPYTTQTFIPLSPPSSPSAPQAQARYLVIVAPTLAASSHPMGLPDLNKTQAFWAQKEQAVTYGAGTWHAPMVVIGDERIDFVVVQFANGVADEDCEEVVLEEEWGSEGEGLSVDVGDARDCERAKL
ncbi:MAG: hypothetical protein LQ338_002950 [Usnochroma carphineum]|nr:MAG: hypothetical protein LQ338_002950 [Usnochroma carphineum]